MEGGLSSASGVEILHNGVESMNQGTGRGEYVETDINGLHGGANFAYTNIHEDQDIHVGRQHHAMLAEQAFDETDSNAKMNIMSTHDPLKASVNTLGHYFSTGVGFLYFIIMAGAAAWMMVVTVLFEQTKFLIEIQVRFISRTFGALGFLVPLFIHGWATEAEQSFNQATKSFARSMQLPVDMALSYKTIAFATSGDESLSEKQNRWNMLHRMFQLTKLLHYLNYSIFVNGHTDKVFLESTADMGSFNEDESRELRDTLGAGAIAMLREISTIMQSTALMALNNRWIKPQEYDMLVEQTNGTRRQASAMAAGALPAKNKMIENHKYLVMAVYLGGVLCVEIYNEVEIYSTIFYAIQIPLLLGPILIPKWLGSVNQNSRRFKDEQYIKMRNGVLKNIDHLQARVKRKLMG